MAADIKVLNAAGCDLLVVPRASGRTNQSVHEHRGQVRLE
jgi:hypothetical protein